MMNEKMYEELKNAVWDNGVEAIDDLLGYEHDVDADTVGRRLPENSEFGKPELQNRVRDVRT